MNGGEERAEYTVYMEAETDAGGVSMVWGLSAWGWGGVGEGGAWVFPGGVLHGGRDAGLCLRVGYAYCYEAPHA